MLVSVDAASMMGGRKPAVWAPEHARGILRQRHSMAPLITEDAIDRIAPHLDIWDAWPIQDDDGAPALLQSGATLWLALGAPRFEDPDERHGHARIHLLEHKDGRWRHLGAAMPDGFSPGSREWSGSALLAPDRQSLTLFFTATGRRGEIMPSFEQRLFSAEATLVNSAGGWHLSKWRGLQEIVERDPRYYMASDAGTGKVGTIKAFRDPAYFRDPADGRRWLLFAGSSASTSSQFNGVIGAIVAAPEGPPEWRLMPPLVDATDVNNELERPHIVAHRGLYYLFWSTQGNVFAPEYGFAPTGLYGMVAGGLDAGWQPLNGTGLVFANPDAAPRQAYSWLVLPDLSVISFIDDWGRGADASGQRRFGATFAPTLRVELDGAEARLAA